MDGFDRPYWNLRQVLTWVYNGDRDLVSHTADDVTDHGYFWQEATTPDGKQEMIKVPVEAPGPIHFIGTAALRGKRRAESYPEAKDEILDALARGKMKAFGHRNNQNELLEISRHHWAGLDFSLDPDLARPRELRAGMVSWWGLQFPSKDVLKVWPETGDKSGSSKPESLARAGAKGRADSYEPSKELCVRMARELWEEDPTRRFEKVFDILDACLRQENLKEVTNKTIRKWLEKAEKDGELQIPPGARRRDRSPS